MASDSDGFDINPNSPRTKVAMRMNGIEPGDISPKKAADFEIAGLYESNKDLSSSRYKFFEKKRHQLVKNVAEDRQVISAHGTHSTFGGTMHSASSGNLESDLMADTLRQEQEKIAKIKAQAKFEIEQIVTADLTQKERVAEGAKRTAESEARLKELIKDRQKELKARAIASEKSSTKKAAARQSAINTRLAENERLIEKMTAAGERATAQLAENAKVWDVRKEENHEKQKMIKDRKDKFEVNLQKGLEKSYEEQLSRVGLLDDKLKRDEEARRIHAEEVSAMFLQNRLRVQHALEEKQSKRENAFYASSEKFFEVQEKGTAAVKLKQKEAKDRNDKAKKKQVKLREEELRKQDALAKETEAKVSRNLSHVELLREERIRDASQRRVETRSMMADLVLQNRERIARAEEFSRNTRLDKIKGTIKRIDAIHASQARVAQRRAVTVKDCFLEKHHLNDKIQQLRDAPEWKYNQLLKSLDLPLPKKDQKEGGEEGEKE